MNAANSFTFLRLLSVIPFAFFLAQEKYILAIAFFAFAGVSDLLDGFIARKFNQKTKLGAYLDPMTDKILIFIGNVILVYQSALPLWFLWFFVFVTMKDLSLMIGVIILKLKKIDWEPHPNLYGKVAVFLQVLIILGGIIHKGIFEIKNIILVSVIVCSLFTLISWILYTIHFFNLINRKRGPANAC